MARIVSCIKLAWGGRLCLRLLKTLVVTSKCRTFVCYNMHSIYTLAFNGTRNGKFHNIYTRAHTHTDTLSVARSQLKIELATRCRKGNYRLFIDCDKCVQIC